MKINKYIMALSATILVVSCMKESSPLNNEQSTEEIIITAQAAEETRTVITDERQIYWEPADEIKVFRGSESGRFRCINEAEGPVGRFKGNLSVPLDFTENFEEIWALYPYQESATFDGSSITASIPSSQVSRPGSFSTGNYLTVGKSTSFSMGFYAVGATICVYVPQDGVTKIAFGSLGGEEIAGKAKICFKNDCPSVEILEGYSSIELKPEGRDTFESGEYYYFNVFPATLSDGLFFRIEKGNEVSVKTTERELTIQRAHMINISVPFPDKGLEIVDLGLPSGTLWTSCNIGASSPEESGNYYAWGETLPKGKYNWANYKWCTGDKSSLTKYNSNPENGVTDFRTALLPEDDIATYLLGGSYRMPTEAELEELIINCKWTWSSYNGIPGYFIYGTAEGFTDKYIFIPAAGIKDDQNHYVYENGYCCIWTLTADSVYNFDAAQLCSDETSPSILGGFRFWGTPVRAVCAPRTRVTSIMIDRETLDLRLKDGYAKLTASIYPEKAVEKSVVWKSSNENVVSVSSNGAIKAIATGKSIITATSVDGGYSSSCEVNVNDSDFPEAVDLGLSVKWASCNLGASRPEDFGAYFGWGETEMKESFTWNNYDLSKYTSSTILQNADDAANRLLGGSWRIPSYGEFAELIKKCTWTRTEINNVQGYNVIGPSGASIFLPFSGGCVSSDGYYFGLEGNYWTCERYEDNRYYHYSYELYIDDENFRFYAEYRYYGFSIRPVFGNRLDYEEKPGQVGIDSWRKGSDNWF